MTCSRYNFARPHLRGLSMVELTMALLILAIISTAITSMTLAALNTQRYSQSQDTASAEMDAALRRIIYNIRTAAATPTWGTYGTFNALQLTHTGVSGTIAYYVDNSGNLVESDSRFNIGGQPNTLVHNVGSANFTCTIAAVSSTQLSTLVTINVSVQTSPPVVRKVIVGARGY